MDEEKRVWYNESCFFKKKNASIPPKKTKKKMTINNNNLCGGDFCTYTRIGVCSVLDLYSACGFVGDLFFVCIEENRWIREAKRN